MAHRLNCHSCGFDNPQGMRFCGNCGARLDGDLESKEKFGQNFEEQEKLSANRPIYNPEQLGILTGSDLLDRFRKAGLEASGQRRNVTVLFVDLSDYTQLSEHLRDEDLFYLVQKYIRLLVNVVFKYEGIVDKLTGDGLMALFGAPIAHENNAERAIRCAIDMVSEVEHLNNEFSFTEQELKVHIGLNSGTVIVGGVGSDGLMNYTAIGDSVNLARRLEEEAAPGTILVSESVYKQTLRQFDFEKLPVVSLKNVSKKITPFKVKSLKARSAITRGIDGLRAPMIGRDDEFDRVMMMINRLKKDSWGGMLLLVGEGGIGKSRLTREIKNNLDKDNVIVLEGQSLTYRKSISYWIFQDILRNFLDIPADSLKGEIYKKIREAKGTLYKENEFDKRSYIEHVFNIEPSDSIVAEQIKYLDPGQLRQQVFITFRDFLINLSNKHPVLLILEDIHWADEASLDLIRYLIDTTRNYPILIYVISRPFEGGALESIHERAQQRLGDRYAFIRLNALLPDQSAQLLKELLSLHDLPESIRGQVIQKSSGLPFYLEEIIRMLIEESIIQKEGQTWLVTSGAENLRIGVPDTLQGLILSRFDRLSITQRRLLQIASVIGYQFSYQILRQILITQIDGISNSEMYELLNVLVEKEFIQTLESNVIHKDHDEKSVNQNYQFKHVLVSDAVYSTLLKKDREELHTRVGETIERIYNNRLDNFIEVLASHYLRSPYIDRAFHYLLLAGQKAAHSFANTQALQLYRQAYELLSEVDHTQVQEIQLYSGMGDALFTAGEYQTARDQYVHALDVLGVPCKTQELRSFKLFEGASDLKGIERICLISQLHRKISKTYESQGDYEKALLYLETAEIVHKGENEAFDLEQANTLNDAGWIYFRKGNLDKAEEFLIRGLSLAEKNHQLDVIGSINNRLAGIYFQRDSVDIAAMYLSKSLEIRERIGDVVATARTYNNLGLISWKQGELNKALDNFNRCFQLQANLGDVEGQIVLHTNMGLIETDRGKFQQAQQHFQEALETADQIGHFYHVCMARMHLALLNVYSQNWLSAIENGQQSLNGFQQLGVEEHILDLKVSLGWAYLGLGEELPKRDTERELINLLSQGNEPSEGQGRAYRLLAQYAIERGENERAFNMLGKSVAIFSKLGNHLERGRSLVSLGKLLESQGNIVDSSHYINEAREIFEKMGAKIEYEKLRTS